MFILLFQAAPNLRRGRSSVPSSSKRGSSRRSTPVTVDRGRSRGRRGGRGRHDVVATASSNKRSRAVVKFQGPSDDENDDDNDQDDEDNEDNDDDDDDDDNDNNEVDRLVDGNASDEVDSIPGEDDDDDDPYSAPVTYL